MEALLKDLMVTIRSLWKRPSFTIVVILTLALGIGACAAVFTVVNSVLLRPLPFGDPEHLVLIPSLNRDDVGKIEEYGTSVTDFLDWRERGKSFSDLAAMQPTEVALTGAGDPEQLDAGLVSANLFATLRVRPYAGRFFEPQEEVENSTVAVLGYDLWQRRFGGSTEVLKKSVVVDGIARQVIGIAPQNFFFAANADILIPLNLRIPKAPRISMRNTAIAGRLKPNVTVETASNEIKNIADQLAHEFPSNVGWGAKAVPIREPYVRDVKDVLIYLFIAVVFLLLIVCVNVANLVLVRNLERHPELVLRVALGGSHAALLRQSFVENMLLTGCGAVLGIILSAFAIKPMVVLSPIVASSPAGNRILSSVSFDYRVILFVIALSIIAAIVLSAVSFIRIKKTELVDALKSGARSSVGGAYERKSQKTLVIAQLSISFLLLIGAGLMLKTFLSLKNINPGFKTESLLTARISLPALRYESHEKRAEFQKQLLEKVSGLPGVVSDSASTRLPLNEFGITTSFMVDGIANPEDGFISNFRRVAPDYFKTLQTSIVEGNEFSQTDISNSMPVAIVSREFEKHFWPGQSAIGKRIRRQSQTDHNWRTIIGVVKDVKDSSLTAVPGLTLYIPYFQSSIPSFYLVVRTSTNPAQVIGPLRAAVRELDKDLPVYQITSAEELFMDSLSRPRFAAYLLASFALIGLFVALIGIYGVVSYTTNRRVNEIGLRMAIGASKKSILFLILEQSARLILWGLLIGSVMAMIFERSVSSLWDKAGNPYIYIVTAAILILAALASSLLPALRATRINPTAALRYQ